MRGLSPTVESGVRAQLDARLDPASPAPLALALSGGGDSLALALMTAAWARERSRPLLVLTVDHGLHADSAAWTRTCGETARRIGAGFRALAWSGPKPSSGLPAAARRARHRLLAQAAREAGARVLLMGHTLDDMAEAGIMRASGSTTPSPRAWSPSPAWPEGRDLFLLRPLLGIRREALRAWLRSQGETWLEDPANADPRFARSRARAALAGHRAEPAACLPEEADARSAVALALAFRTRPFGLEVERERLQKADPGARRRAVSAACLSAAGGMRSPRGEALDRLANLLAGEAPVRATLAGALVLADARTVAFGRTAGEMRRQGALDLVLEAGGTGVFDGRVEVLAAGPVRITPLEGRLSRLPPPDRAILASSTPPAYRGALPGITQDGTTRLAGTPGSGVRVRPLARDRLLAACGAFPDERATALSPDASG